MELASLRPLVTPEQRERAMQMSDSHSAADEFPEADSEADLTEKVYFALTLACDLEFELHHLLAVPNTIPPSRLGHDVYIHTI